MKINVQCMGQCKLFTLPVRGELITCPSAERLCSIPERKWPPRPVESSSSELPPSKPGLKLGRLLSPTCKTTTESELLNTGDRVVMSCGSGGWAFSFLTSCLEVLGSRCDLTALLVLADSNSSSVSSSLAGQESIPVAASRTSGIWKSSWSWHVDNVQEEKQTTNYHLGNSRESQSEEELPSANLIVIIKELVSVVFWFCRTRFWQVISSTQQPLWTKQCR